VFTFKASATSGLILFVFNLEKYTITWVLIMEDNGKRPSSEFEAILLAVF
jgi:hypothetical protein